MRHALNLRIVRTSQSNSDVIEIAYNIPEPGHVHYLPERAVVREDKTTSKVRVVFDNSFSATNSLVGSLNSFLYTGPSLTRWLFGVLLRFRMFKFGFVPDIGKAFLQIILNPAHRDFACFLWFKEFDPSKRFDDLELENMQMCRVLFGVR